ncbi:MAG: hypothetical protein ACI85Q_000903 [Salibacteraceae bacterium]|jgi:hypothetical protein
MKVFLRIQLVLVSLFTVCSVQSQVLVSATDLGLFPKALISFSGLTNAEYNVQMYKVTYNTTDNTGANVIASGMIAVPINSNCDSLPIALYAHGTVLLREGVPSRNNDESLLGKAFASRGYVTAMPDYLGLGDLPGLHPYQHAESEARVSVDIIRATIEFMEDSLSYIYNNQVYLSGYSQGGHTAMATHKYIQDNNLETELNVIASAPLSGSFHSSSTQARIVLDDMPFGSQGFVIYMIMAYNDVYGGIYTTPSDYLQSPYDVTIPPLLDGNHDFTELNDSLPNLPSQFLDPTFLANLLADSSTKSTSLWQALLDNDNYDWKPNVPMKLFYCSGDQTVFPQNTLDAFDAMTANGAAQVFKEDLGNLSHTGCILPAISNAINFFENLRPNCGVPASVSPVVVESFEIQLSPNPSSQMLEITSNSLNPVILSVYSITGVEVHQSNFSNTVQLDVSNWKNGLYYVKTASDKHTSFQPLVIQH